MDKYDKEILSVLLENGKIQLSELSKKTNLSVSSCQRRVKNLEESGVIESSQAVVNPSLSAWVSRHWYSSPCRKLPVKKSQNLKKPWKKFPASSKLHGSSASRIYVLLVATPDLTAYQEAYDTQLSSLPNIKKVETTLLMKEIIPHRIILLPE